MKPDTSNTVILLFGSKPWWEVFIWVTLYCTIALGSLCLNSSLLYYLKFKLGYRYQEVCPVITQLAAYQAGVAIEAVIFAIPVHLYIHLTGNQDPLLCVAYDWHTLIIAYLTYAIIITSTLLRYAHVFHPEWFQDATEQDVYIVTVGSTVSIPLIAIFMRIWVEHPSKKGFSFTLCATQLTKPLWGHPIMLAIPHIINAVLFLAYLKMLRRMESMENGMTFTVARPRRVNLIDAKDSAITIIVVEVFTFLCQLWNIVDPEILPQTYHYLVQELAFLSLYASPLAIAAVYCISRPKVCSWLTDIWKRPHNCRRLSPRIQIEPYDTSTTHDSSGHM